MRRPVLYAIAALALVGSALVVTSVPASAHRGQSFSDFLRKYETANSAFVNGDASLWMPLVSHSDKTSIFGGFGGHEVGWDQVGPRYVFAASQFRPSGAEVSFEYLQKHVDDDTAYYVAIERSTVLYINGDEPQPQVLRATMIFRKEHGKWKIVHRHADFLAPNAPPPTD